MKQKLKQLIGLVLVLSMCMGLFPATVLGAEIELPKESEQEI